MKKFLSPIFLVFLTCFITSCENEPLEGEFGNPDDGSSTAESSFQANVDGTLFIADDAFAESESGITVISGFKQNGENISMTIFGASEGDYSLSDQSIAMYATLGETPYGAGGDGAIGSVTITDYNPQDGLISGTFSFTGEREFEDENGDVTTQTIEITDGTFVNVELESDVTTDPQDPDALFEVELDDELFSTDQITSATLNEDGLLVQVEIGDESVGFQIFEPAVGDFDLGNEDEALVAYDPDITDEDSPAYISMSGTITITELDMSNNLVSGNFSGMLQEFFDQADPIEMTNGVFENIAFTNDGPTDTMTAMVDGNEFNADLIIPATAGSTVTINFTSTLDNRITIVIPEDVTVGTYNVNAPIDVDFSGSYTTDVDTPDEIDYDSVADSGEITITDVNNGVVSGTFNFTAEDSNGNTVEITQGEFMVDISF